RISVRLLRAYTAEPYGWHLNKNIAELTRSLTTDTDLFTKGIIHAMELVTEAVVCVVLGCYLFTVSHSITVVVLGIMGLSLLLFTSISKRMSRNLGKEAQECNGLLIRTINESLGGIKELKVLRREKYFLDRYDRVSTKYLRALRVSRLVGGLPRYVVEATCMSGLLVAIIVKMYFGQREIQAFIPQLSVFAVAAFRLLPSVGKINEHFSNILYAAPSIDLIYHDLREVEEAAQESADRDHTWKLRDRVEIRHLSFRYPGAEEDVLKDVTFAIPKGRTVALIGSSGAGKTTLADILLGLLTPERGHIMADEMDIFKNLATWQGEIGYIPQTIFLSDDTIRRNIAFGIPDEEIDEERVRDAAEKAQLTAFIETLPDGMDTIVGERGARISGGQRQRIGIARALYTDPEVMVLDEATSALDGETETAVMEAIDSLHGTKTMIIIAHRLTTIRNADLIYEVENGQVTERSKEEVFREG
ncbi:MAG: ABC transporter ATP-binding protein, partial [Lachnospiraceae bacterium]|nr:ABC transporter ATP-binding protein [Lachnospiraceae bacterium]